MKINELSKAAGVPKRTVHFYIKEGLLKPDVNPDNNYYEFDQEDLDRLLLIRKLRSADMPVAMIRSLLEKPSTASYFLNLYVRRLYLQQKYISSTIETMNSIVEDLPIHTDYTTIRNIFAQAELPRISDMEPYDYDKYDNSLVNYFLWGKFLPSEEFSEYQEYLWKKIDRQTRTNPTQEYKDLCRFLKQLDPQIVEELYAESKDYNPVASCTPEQFPVLLASYKEAILHLLHSPHLIALWKDCYNSFFLPQTVIFSSKISNLVCEISPFFVDYTENIHRICQALYDWICEEQPKIGEELHQKLDPCCDIDPYYHGLLAAMVSCASLYRILT